VKQADHVSPAAPTAATEPWVALAVVCAAELGVLLAGAELAALAFGAHQPLPHPSHVLGATVRLGHHLSDPAAAWPTAEGALLPGPVAYWATTAAVQLALAVGAGWAATTWGRRSRIGSRARGRPGFASRAQVRRQLSARAVRRRAPRVRPRLSLRRRAAHQLGLSLGRDVESGRRLHGSTEDSYLVLGPPRGGKGVGLIIPGVLAYPGPVVVTATRTDTLLHTVMGRARRGPVTVFDPQDLAGWATRLQWSPVAGCADPQVAILRAAGFAAAARLTRGTTADGEYWQAQAAAVIRCYLHAADLDGRRVTDVLAWVGRPQDPTPVRILREQSGAAPAWAEELAAQARDDPRHRDSVWGGVRRAFDALADPRVLDACSPPPGQAFDAATFLRDQGAIYLVGSPGAQLSVAPLVTAFVEDVVDTARRLAAAGPSGRLDPPLGLWLDEAANIAPLPSLPNLMSEGGGSGVTTVMVLQSLAQARARWGEAQTDALWDAATLKVVLGGLAHERDLRAIAALAGDVDQEVASRTRSGTGVTESTSLRLVPALPIDRLRNLEEWRAVVLHRRTPPVEAHLAPWWELDCAKDVAAGWDRARSLTERTRRGRADASGGTRS
jgi:type IV secretory pathway TraG/TraD family ATPase VirD4